MASGYIRNPASNFVVPIEAINCISAQINADNTYSFRYSSNADGTGSIYLSPTTYPDAISAIQAAYNTLVIELP